MKYVFLLMLFISFSLDAVPPPRGIDPVEAKKRERINKIQREKDRRDDMWCYITKRKKLSDGGLQCIYNNVGPGFGCPSSMNVLRRGR